MKGVLLGDTPVWAVALALPVILLPGFRSRWACGWPEFGV